MQELDYNFSGGMNLNELKIDGITDYKTGAQVGAVIAAIPLAFLGPVGIGAGILLNIGASFFTDKQEKIREQKAKLRKDLTAPSYKMIDDLKENVIKIVEEKIIRDAANKFIDALDNMANLLAKLGYAQTNFAMVLGRRFNDLNIELLTNAIEYSQTPAPVEEITEVEEVVEETSRFSSFLSGAKKMLSRAEKNKNSFFDSVSKKIDNVKSGNFSEAAIFATNAGIFSGFKYLTSGINFLARVPGEEFLVVADKFDADTEKLSAILGNKLVYLPLMQAEKLEAVEKILGCNFYAAKFSFVDKEDSKVAVVLIPQGKVTDTNLALAQQIAEFPIVRR